MKKRIKFFGAACLWAVSGAGWAQDVVPNLPQNRQQKIPTPGYHSKAYSLKKLPAQKPKRDRFIPFGKKHPAAAQPTGQNPGQAKGRDLPPPPKGNPVTLWAPGKKKNYSTLYQDPR